MAETETIALRITVTDAERAVATLRQIGAEGQKAIGAAADGAGKFAAGARTALSQVGFQLQDIIVQLQAGQRPLSVFIQQGSQIAAAFGPLGAIIGAVGSALAIATGAMLGFSAAAAQTTSTLDAVVQALDAQSSAAKRYATTIAEATEEQRRFLQAAAAIDLARVRSGVAEAAEPIGAELKRRVDEQLRREARELSRSTRPFDLAPVEAFGDRARAMQRRVGDIRAEIEAAAIAGDPNRVLQLAEQHQLLTGDAPTIEAVSRLLEIARRVQVLEAARRADEASLRQLGGGTASPRVDRSADRAAEAAARAAARAEAQRLREISRFELSELVRRAELGEFDDARSLAARERAEKIIAEDARLRVEAAKRAASELEREAERQARILSAPFEEAAAATQRAFADAFEAILADGEVKFGEIAESLGSALQRSVAQIPALLVSAPITSAANQLSSSLASALATGSLANLGAALASPLGMGALGATAGSFMGGTAGAVGGTAGGVLGAIVGNWLFPGPVGTVVGGALGGLAGGALGGLFGGGGGNNRAGARIDLATGLVLPGTDDLSSANQRRANEIVSQLAAVRALLAAGGGVTSGGELRVRIGDRSGAELFTPGGRQRFADVDQLRDAALEALLRSTRGLSDTFRTVIEKTRGERPEVLRDALSFAATFERLVEPSAEVVQSFRALQVELEQAAAQAERYGLSVERVREAQARAAEEAERDLRDQLFGQRDRIEATLGSIVTMLGDTLTSIRVGGLTALAPADQLAEARRAFERELEAARRGDLEAQQRIGAVAQTYLAEAREFGASGAAFQAVFREVNAALLEVQRSAASQQDRLLALLPDAIRDAQTPVIETLERQTRELVAAWDGLKRELARWSRVA